MSKNEKMEDQITGSPVIGEQNAQQRKMRFVEEGVKTQYANAFNIGFGGEEVVFLFGNQSLEPNVVRIESKMAVSIKTAKRIAVTLGNMLRRHEAIHGVVDISVPRTTKDDEKNLQ
ncbi:MAG: hypothetical protein CVU51_01095 [Deltaproteobacteria bacterium HGW-Deltaproteobacteria-1]|jgi:uncharacterized Fe-S center protein|nr:MAG: hypothetical protein CVU51_01095 [Deltaproteobacteria bacterium HGW-Deltaproteobacteria-1]